MHVDSADAPTLVEYLPAPQSRQVAARDAPAVAEYLPAPQVMHVDSADAPAAAEYLPAPQSVHKALPMVVLYFPAPQAVQATPSGPEKPATHTQSASASLPVGACVLEGQD